MNGGVRHLRANGCSLVLDTSGRLLPRVLHWGADLGELSDSDLEALASSSVGPVAPNTMDEPVALSVLPEHSVGWSGLPGLCGHRQGRDWSPLFSVESEEAGGDRVIVASSDQGAQLALRLEIEMSPSGLVEMRAAVRNTHANEVYVLDGLTLTLPVPTEAGELLDLTGRHCRERSPQRQPFTAGCRVRDSRRGRTGSDATLVLVAGTPGFGFLHGEVWALHVGWSGNHRTYAERLPSGVALLGGGELLLPGEVRLDPGEEYEGPTLYASYGRGLDAMSARFHEYLRARPAHPRSPRPVNLNTWEAVYFDQDLDRLLRLAEVGATVGAERYVLDDGWFKNRRDDHAGLGDWVVDESVWPKGLHPLVDRVRELGMVFGLWVEPEMVNPDSDLARAHPEWLLATGGRQPPLSRHQQVLDFAHPEVTAHLSGLLDALLDEYEIGYLKWDHNRDLVDAGHSPGGEAGVHQHTLAVYRFLDRLRQRHPALEIESCSSGGARVDLGILQRADRVWGSDTNDALERQAIQRWTELLLPPELIGAHVGPPQAHTTGRTQSLSFRAGTAIFGHFGIEWDITAATDAELDELRHWVDCYKELRSLLHTGRVVRSDHRDPAVWVHGVVGRDATEAVFALVTMTTGAPAPPGRVRLPGLDPSAVYRVRPIEPSGASTGGHAHSTPWLRAGGITVTGRVLIDVGVQAPLQHPEHLQLLHLKRV